jgi:3-isopropylmalate dehydrogenase
MQPCKAFKGNPLNYRDDVDLVVFMESIEDLYSCFEFHPAPENIIRLVFEYMNEHSRKSETLFEKPNVIRETSRIMIQEARKIAKEFSNIEFWVTHVDEMFIWLVNNPQDYNVLVASNMFGDIISDLSTQLV